MFVVYDFFRYYLLKYINSVSIYQVRADAMIEGVSMHSLLISRTHQQREREMQERTVYDNKWIRRRIRTETLELAGD